MEHKTIKAFGEIEFNEMCNDAYKQGYRPIGMFQVVVKDEQFYLFQQWLRPLPESKDNN